MIHTLPLLLALPGGPAPECASPPAVASPLTVASRDITKDVQAAISAFDEAYSAWIERLRAASEEEREALYGERPSPADTCVKLLELAGKEPASEGGFQAYQWVAGSGSPDQQRDAAMALAAHHLENEQLADVVMGFAYSGPSILPALEKIAAGSPNRATQGCAKFVMGKLLAAQGEMERSKALIEEVIKSYGDLKVYGGRRELGPLAEGMLFEATRLQIGMETPDIDGEDIDGVAFKLSDYKGKVVMLDFWGDW